MMFGLPKTTEVNRPLPKKAVFERSGIRPADKQGFDKEIRKVTILNEVSPDTVNIAAGNAVNAFYIMLVNLHEGNCSSKNIALLSKHIPQNVLFVLEHNGYARLAVRRADTTIQSDLKPLGEWSIELNGLDLGATWENVIAAAGNIDVAEGRTLDEQIAADRERNGILQRIERLEIQAQKEKQPRRKWELAEEAKKLKLQTEAQR